MFFTSNLQVWFCFVNVYLRLLFIYFERERERERSARARERLSRGGAERGRGRIPSRLHAASPEPDVGLDLVNPEIMTRAETESQALNGLSHPGRFCEH